MWRFRDMKDEAERIYASVLSHADDRIGQVLATLPARPSGDVFSKERTKEP